MPSNPSGLSRNTAQGIVAALGLPEQVPQSSLPGSTLPLGSLHRLPRDASMVYEIARMDASGRAAASSVVEALRWRPGDKLSVALTEDVIVIRTSPDGLLPVPRRPCVVIPAKARRRHAINAGDPVLLAAAPDWGVLIVYPMAALDEMIASYHSASSARQSA